MDCVPRARPDVARGASGDLQLLGRARRCLPHGSQSTEQGVSKLDLTYQLIDKATGFVSDSLVDAILTIQRHVETNTPAASWELTLTRSNGNGSARIRVNGLKISLRALEPISSWTDSSPQTSPDTTQS